MIPFRSRSCQYDRPAGSIARTDINHAQTRFQLALFWSTSLRS